MSTSGIGVTRSQRRHLKLGFADWAALKWQWGVHEQQFWQSIPPRNKSTISDLPSANVLLQPVTAGNLYSPRHTDNTLAAKSMLHASAKILSSSVQANLVHTCTHVYIYKLFIISARGLIEWVQFLTMPLWLSLADKILQVTLADFLCHLINLWALWGMLNAIWSVNFPFLEQRAENWTVYKWT